MVSIPLPSSYNKGDSLRFDASGLVNFFAVPASQGQQSRQTFYLQGTEGLTPFYTASPAEQSRMLAQVAGTMYGVGGTTLRKFTNAGVATSIGTINGSNTVSKAKISGSTSNQQLVMVTENTGYSYDTVSTTLSTIVDADYPLASSVTAINQKAVISVKDTGQYAWSDTGNSLAWNGLDYATAEGNDDNLQAVLANYGDLVLFGKETIEVVRDNGDTFTRIGSPADIGLAGVNACTTINNAFYWLGHDGSIYGMSGYSPQEISTYPICDAIKTLSRVDDCEAWSYTNHGHKFVVFTFPYDKRTFVFEAKTGLWHERLSYVNGSSWAWRARHYAYAYGNHYAGDIINGNIWQIDKDAYTEGGEAIRRRIDLNFVPDGINSFVIDRFELVIDTGYGGYTAGAIDDAKVNLSVSYDGGGIYQLIGQQSAGTIGNRRQRVIFYGLGQFDIDAKIRIEVSAAIPWRIISADAVLERRGK